MTCIRTRMAVCAFDEPGTVGMYVKSGIKVTTKTMAESTVKMLAAWLVKRTNPAYRSTATIAGTTVKMTAH